MSVVGNKIITPPVSIRDVQTVLCTSSNELGQLCKSGNVNKWSLWKPMRLSGLTSPTCAQVVAAHCGIDISGAKMASLKNALNGSNKTLTPSDIQVQASQVYTYNQPTGGTSSPYRLTDFADNVAEGESSASTGWFVRNYNNGAKSPDHWDDWQIGYERMNGTNVNTDPGYKGLTVTDSDITIEDAGTGRKWSVTKPAAVYQNCGIRFGPNVADNVGGADSDAMPLSYLFGAGLIANEVWRLGLAVYIPSASSSAIKWELITGIDWIKGGNLKGMPMGRLLPSPITNLRAFRSMAASTATEFDAIPVLVKNCTLGRTGYGGPNQYITYVSMAEDGAEVYISPSTQKIKIQLLAQESTSLCSGSSSAYTAVWLSPILGGHTYHICKTTVVAGSGGVQSHVDKYYTVQLTGASFKMKLKCDASTTFEAGYGHIAFDGAVQGSTTATVREYADYAAYKAGVVSSQTNDVTSATAIAKYFYAYRGNSAATVNLSFRFAVDKSLN